jgi:hypothetical protein
MPVRYLSAPELARLSTWPCEIADEDGVTFFTLSDDDRFWLAGFTQRPVASTETAFPAWLPNPTRRAGQRPAAPPQGGRACLDPAPVGQAPYSINVTGSIKPHVRPCVHILARYRPWC